MIPSASAGALPENIHLDVIRMFLVIINPTAGNNSAVAAGQAICRLLK